MTTWTNRDDVRQAVERLWSRGLLLNSAWTGKGLAFPYRVNLNGPTSTQLSDRFDEARKWIAGLEGLPLVWREFTHPRLGRNRVPIAVEWGSCQELLTFVRREADTRRFTQAAIMVVQAFAALSPWVERYPLRLLERVDDLPRLLAVTRWMVGHPRPELFLRQVDVPGVHTKFLESHRGLLAEWFDLVLPTEAIDVAFSGVGQFCPRYGFATKPRFVRFRPLDPTFGGPQDLAWRAQDWLEGPARRRIVIVENEVTYLSLPPLSQAWAVFGAGYGFDGWGQSPWMDQAEVWYWGDLDTHGFAILDQLRAELPRVRSLLMDEETLLSHREFWGREDSPTSRTLPLLTEAEQSVYQGLVGDRWGPQLRLEQEHLNYQWVCEFWESLFRPK